MHKGNMGSTVQYSKQGLPNDKANDLYIICAAGKNRGPAKPYATMLWISMFCSLDGLHSFKRMNLPDLKDQRQYEDRCIIFSTWRE